MFKLIIEDDEGKTTVVPLIRDEITIGRKEGNTIRLTERNVSRRHAKLLRNNGAVFIEDLESYNGIKVNGTRIAGKVPVREGDRIEIGDYHLALKLEKSGDVGGGGGGGTAAAPGLHDKDTHQLRVDGAPIDEQATVRILAPSAPPPVPAMDPSGAARPPMLGEGQPALAVPQSPPHPARLVAISQQLGGLEFKLDKAAMVIGRTDENDVVLNHRSISRHHAKIIYEGGRYQIIDLESSNGVRVNGEEYGRVELCRGDIIELGHVRLRFVEAGEEYRFDPATAIDTTAGSRRGMIAATMVVVGLLGLAGAIAYHRGLFARSVATTTDGGASGTAVIGSGSGGGETGPAAPGVNPPTADGGAANPPAPTGGEVESLLAEAGKAAGAREWSKAAGLYGTVLEKQPDNVAARQAKARVEEEVQNQATFDKLKEAADGKEWDRALPLFESLSPKSVYQQDARELAGKVKDGYLARHRDLASRALREKKPDVARQEVDLVLKQAPDDSEGQAILRKLEKSEQKEPPKPPTQATAPAVKERPQQPKPPRVVEKRQPKPPVAVAVPTQSPDELQKAAQGAYLGGNYTEAAKLATQLSRSRPVIAWRLATMAQCKQKNNAAVRSFTRFVRVASSSGEFEATKQLLKSVCQANGITLP
jgi:pSer/pThr/pTyr-binding forkhead associated (FHA) protein